MTPTDLGESGYVTDIPEVDHVHKQRNGDLILHAPSEVENELGEEIGRVAAGRWDCYVFLDEPPATKAAAKKAAPRRDKP